MVCYCLDLRGDSKLAKFLANKFVSILVGLVQLVLWSSALLAFMVQPGPLKEQIQTSEPGAIAFAVILVLACIGFSILLLIGIYKGNRCYIRTYLVFILVLTVLIVVSMIVNIFTQPRRFGLSGFLSSTFMTFLNLLTYFILRNYYLAFISKDQNQINPNRV